MRLGEVIKNENEYKTEEKGLSPEHSSLRRGRGESGQCGVEKIKKVLYTGSQVEKLFIGRKTSAVSNADKSSKMKTKNFSLDLVKWS